MLYMITLTQPWATAVMLDKDLENRPMRPLCVGVGGRLVIHAGGQYDEAAHAALVRSGMLPALAPMPSFAILGSVQVGGWIGQSADKTLRGESIPAEWEQMTKLLDSPWRQPESRWHWWVRDKRPLPAPLPCKGTQGLRLVPEQYRAALEAL